MPHLYHDDLETLDFMEALGRRLEGWYDLAHEVGQVQGRWVAMPWYCAAQPMTYRGDLYKQHGFPPPQTWEAWKRTGHQIRESSGHQVGVTLNEGVDSNLTLYALLWSYGTSTVDADGRVSINSPATRRAMDYIKELYTCCMPVEVLSWDASGNNQAFLSGTYSWVHNATSIYGFAKHNVSKLRDPKVFEGIDHTLTPAGPGGQHGTATPNNYGIWRFAKEKELAKAFLQYLMDRNRMELMFHVTATFNTPLLKIQERFDWQRDPKTAVLKDYMKTAHMMGWPAPSDHRAEQAVQQDIVPKMFASYVTGKLRLEDAVAWGEAALQDLYKAQHPKVRMRKTC
jgi:multiple sugar transport system substrate-binding protein